MPSKKIEIALLQRVKEHVHEGSYVLVRHAILRKDERQIHLPHILHVLKNGRHEKEKDFFDIKRQIWKYAVRGKTVDGVDLRVIVAFEEKMLIITVIRIKT